VNDWLLVLDAVGRVEVRRHEKKSVATRPLLNRPGKLLRTSVAAPRCCSRVHRQLTEHRVLSSMVTVGSKSSVVVAKQMHSAVAFGVREAIVTAYPWYISVIAPPATMNGHLGLVALSTFTEQPLKNIY
jgi:hypothetical protein